MINLKKKGLSPLIATVLLIAIAITIGAVISTFGNKLTRDTTESSTDATYDMKCNGMDFSFKKLNNENFLCDNTTHVRMMIDNVGTEDSYGIILNLVYKNFSTVSFKDYVNETTKMGESIVMTFAVQDVSNVSQFEIQPLLENKRTKEKLRCKAVLDFIPNQIESCSKILG